MSTAGSLENITRLTQERARCAETFAVVQDGIPVPPDSGIKVLGRLPEPESLLLLARRVRPITSFADLRGTVIGIGPEQSGTAHFAFSVRRIPCAPLRPGARAATAVSTGVVSERSQDDEAGSKPKRKRQGRRAGP